MTLSDYIVVQPEYAPSPVALPVPHNADAEQAILGAVFINPNCYYDLATFLRPEHFYIHKNKYIWEAFTTLENRRTPIDLLTVSEELDRKSLLADVGGSAYLTSLIHVVPTSLNAEHYAHIVESHALSRQMLNAASRIARLAYDASIPIEEKLSAMKEEANGMETANSGSNFVKLGALLSDTYDDVVVRAKDPKDVWGFSTGFPSFDKKTGGFQKGELVYLVGGPGVGKTWLELTWGMELGRQAPGAMISLEMRRGAVGRRLLSGISGVQSRNMKSGYMTDGDWPLLTNAIEQYERHPVWIDDSPYDTHKLQSVLTWGKREFGWEWFALDYALLMMDSGRDETEQSKKISANLKRMVNSMDMCGIVLHSVVKIVMEGEAPRQSDQRGSGQAIHDADVQLFLTKLYDKDSKVADLKPADKDKMSTLWCSKGRDLEQSKFKKHLVRRGTSPFWGEFDEGSMPQY
jgi:replicative DNA helicase